MPQRRLYLLRYLPLVCALLVCLPLICFPWEANSVMAQTPPVLVLDRQAAPLTTLVDGNTISLEISMPAAVAATTQVDFRLTGSDTAIANCTIPAGQQSCRTVEFPALGWAWNAASERQTQRVVEAWSTGVLLGESAALWITPRPVILVHGIGGRWEVWEMYLGANGYLATHDLQGYAVGDGQVPGMLDTGNKRTPLSRTNTIGQNADQLGEYISNVQEATGAEQVDLLVHSMGGIIARYYLDRVMQSRNVAQLIILGSPMGGSACSILPAALGLLLPASLELQPSYMEGIFNQQITRRQGVPFHALAGTKMLDAVQSPCAAVPSDLVVPLTSVKAIAMPVAEMAILHDNLNDATEVFTEFVRPLLQTPPGDGWQVADPPPPAESTAMLQFTRVYTGHLAPGATEQVTINIDPNVTVATFALYDTSRSLTTTVTGANGNIIQLDTTTNGVVRVTDPESLIYLGYGFVQPRAGQWVVTLQTTAETSIIGADYAITAQFDGGATLQATVDTLVPQVNEPVNMQAQLTAAGQSITLLSAQAQVRRPDGQLQTYPLTVQGGNASLILTPDQSGLYGVTVNVDAQTADGLRIDRAAFAVFEAQPTVTDILQYRLLAGAILALGLAVIVGTMLFWRRATRRRPVRHQPMPSAHQPTAPHQSSTRNSSASWRQHPLLRNRRPRR